VNRPAESALTGVVLAIADGHLAFTSAQPRVVD
jgi:hypothetical protein